MVMDGVWLFYRHYPCFNILQPPQFDIAMVWMANEVVGLPIEIVIFHNHVSLPQGIYVLGIFRVYLPTARFGQHWQIFVNAFPKDVLQTINEDWSPWIKSCWKI